MYVTDVHITEIDDGNPNSLSDTSYRFHQTLEDALSKNKNISLLLSAGDQATEGLEGEYMAFSSSPLLKSISVATAMGNHDRKGAAYKLFKNVPNEDTEASIGVKVEKASGEKCERCWMYSETVGEDKENPTICKKCSEALK